MKLVINIDLDSLQGDTDEYLAETIKYQIQDQVQAAIKTEVRKILKSKQRELKSSAERQVEKLLKEL